jgi:Transglutaminase-like superfamily
MAGVVPFQVLSSLGCPATGELAIALGAELAPVDEAALDAALDRIAEELAPAAHIEPERQMVAAELVLAQHLRVEAGAERSVGIDDLLPHLVAARGRGHELAVALVALEAARRAGLRLSLVACPDAVFLGHPRLSAPVLLAPAPDWHLLDARDLDEPELAWQCAHEAASLLLGALLERTRRSGLLATELRAAELCLALPVERAEQRRLQRQLAAVRARLN